MTPARFPKGKRITHGVSMHLAATTLQKIKYGLQYRRRPEPQARGKGILRWSERLHFRNKRASIRNDGKLKIPKISVVGSLDLWLYLFDQAALKLRRSQGAANAEGMPEAQAGRRTIDGEERIVDKKDSQEETKPNAPG
jgi:hypothetical protein